MNLKKTSFLCVLFLTLAFWGCGPEPSCLEVTEIMTTEVSPSGVRTLFQVSDCEGNPVSNVTGKNVAIQLDGKAMQSEGNVTAVLNQNVAFELNTLLLLDLSDSIVTNGNLQGMVAAARQLVNTLANQGHNVAIYRFAGPAWFGAVTDFTKDKVELNAALDVIASGTGLGTTDLYGSIPKAVRILEAHKTADILSAESLVLFTDGTDEAMAGTAGTAERVIKNTEVNVFTVGLGGDVNQDELNLFGKDGFEWAANTAALTKAFSKVTALIHNIANSFYLMGICSPRVGGQRSLEIEIDVNGDSGSLQTTYDATGFDIVGCVPRWVAYPCAQRQCGQVDGFVCGTCGETEYCTEAGQCAQACEPFMECGISNGVECGTCDQGPTLACQDNLCVEACTNAECGMVLGVNCGDCSAFGTTFGCTDTLTCVDACGTRECGTINGVNCGDCSAFGETYGCSAGGTCMEACADIQCGTINGVNCGDCSELGAAFGCNSSGVCVDVCTNAQCGTVSGVDCGGCDSGEQCNGANQCVPVGLDSLVWVGIGGGNVTLGCEWALDSNCDIDEARVPLVVPDYYIMNSEVTAGMYAQCVSAGACNPSRVTTTTGCTFTGAPNSKSPLNCVTWEGLNEFCHFVGGELPTEAQWEHAARSGYDGTTKSYRMYPWGDAPPPDCTRVIMNDGGPGCGLGKVHDINSLQPNEFALYDMMGNVSEWTRDWYGETLGGCVDAACISPQGPASGDERVLRGGSYNSMYASAFRTAARDKESPETSSTAIGGRCVREISSNK